MPCESAEQVVSSILKIQARHCEQILGEWPLSAGFLFDAYWSSRMQLRPIPINDALAAAHWRWLTLTDPEAREGRLN